MDNWMLPLEESNFLTGSYVDQGSFCKADSILTLAKAAPQRQHTITSNCFRIVRKKPRGILVKQIKWKKEEREAKTCYL